jgi:hypothetical protein
VVRIHPAVLAIEAPLSFGHAAFSGRLAHLKRAGPDRARPGSAPNIRLDANEHAVSP